MNYQRIYDQICQRAKSELEKRKEHNKNGGYYEGHHIIPKCLGGLGKYQDYDNNNIALLTPKEHYICHKLLIEIYRNHELVGKLKYALFSLGNMHKAAKRIIRGSIEYDRVRKEFISTIKGVKHSKTHNENSKKAINTPEVKMKKSIALSGRIFSESHKDKLKAMWQDEDHIQRTKENMKKAALDPIVLENRRRASKIGNEKQNSGADVKCPYCDKIGKISRIKQFHFDNCKHKPQ